MKFRNPKSLLFFFLFALQAIIPAVVLGQNDWRGDSVSQIFGPPFTWQHGPNWSLGDPTDGTGGARQVRFGAILGASLAVELSEGGSQAADTVNFLGTAGAFTLSGPDRLTLTANAAVNALQNDSNNLQTIQNGVFLAGTNRTIGNTSTGSFRFDGEVKGGAFGAANQSINVSNTGSGTITFNGNVNAAGITKSGSGAVVFNGLVSSTINVTGGLMQGTGQINSLTTIGSGASYSAGNGIGSQNLAGGLTFSANGATPNFVFDVNKTAPNTFTFDTVTVGGEGLNIGTGFRTEIANTGTSLVAGDFWDVFSSSNGIANSGNLTANLFNITGSNPNGLSFQWSVFTSGGNTIGRITAVPEPSSMALLGMAGLIGGVYARRRAKKNKA